MDAREEIEKKRAERKQALKKAQETQELEDLKALDALEMEHGDSNVSMLKAERYVSGQPTIVVLKAPERAYYKRFCDQIAAASTPNQRREAQETLANAVWIYPATPEARESMLNHFPGLLVSIVIRAAKMVEANVVDEGKG